MCRGERCGALVSGRLDGMRWCLAHAALIAVVCSASITVEHGGTIVLENSGSSATSTSALPGDTVVEGTGGMTLAQLVQEFKQLQQFVQTHPALALPPSIPPPSPLSPPPPTPPMWLFGTCDEYDGNAEYSHKYTTLRQAMDNCIADASCEYVVDHDCTGGEPGNIFADALAASDSSTLAADSFYAAWPGSGANDVVASTGASGFTTSGNAWRLRTAAALSGLIIYPSSGWNARGGKHCVLQKP